MAVSRSASSFSKLLVPVPAGLFTGLHGAGLPPAPAPLGGLQFNLAPGRERTALHMPGPSAPCRLLASALSAVLTVVSHHGSPSSLEGRRPETLQVV